MCQASKVTSSPLSSIKEIQKVIDKNIYFNQIKNIKLLDVNFKYKNDNNFELKNSTTF